MAHKTAEKRAIIIHCWGGYPRYCWYQKTKKELERLGFKVAVPRMPQTGAPNLSRWLPKLKRVVGLPDEQLVLIGHSIGCATIFRYLESLRGSARVCGIVLVAGFTNDLGFKELKSFFTKPFAFKRIRSRAKYFTAIYSDNDPFVPVWHAGVLRKKLGARVIKKHAMGHFSGAGDGEKACVSLPDVARVIKVMKVRS